MLLLGITEKDIVVIFDDEAAEGVAVYENFLGVPVVLLVGDEVVAVLAIVAEEEMPGRGVAEDGVVHLLVVKAIGLVEGYPVVVSILQQGQDIPVVIDHQLLVVLDQLRENQGITIDVKAEGGRQ